MDSATSKIFRASDLSGRGSRNDVIVRHHDLTVETVIRWVNVDLLKHILPRAPVQSSESTVSWHNCDISDTDVLWLLPAEEDNFCEFYRFNERRISKHFAVFLKADPHLLMNLCSDQPGRKVDNTDVVLSL